MRIIIAGGRDFTDYDLLKKSVSEILRKTVDLETESVTVVSGRCRGADRLGERYAGEHGMAILPMPADWIKHGKAAGSIRNQDMAVIASRDKALCICFWDRKSSGTFDMIQAAHRHRVPVEVIEYDVPKEPNLFDTLQ